MKNFKTITGALIVALTIFVSCRQDKANSVTDIDGNVYNTVTIGTQIWMVENLKVTKYCNGDPLLNTIKGEQWSGLSTGSYCNYNNDPNNSLIYGNLYNWYAVNDDRNLAPSGWHIATYDDWTKLIDYIGGKEIAGGILKEAGVNHWQDKSLNATNEKGFTALPAGFRNSNDGSYSGIGQYTNFWSATDDKIDCAWICIMYYDNNKALMSNCSSKKAGFSIRCVKD